MRRLAAGVPRGRYALQHSSERLLASASEHSWEMARVFRLAQTRIWLLPLSIVGGAALSVFALSYWIDASLSPNPAHALRLVFRPNPQAAA